MKTQTLAVECAAVTIHGKAVVLPEGAEVKTSRAALSAYMKANPGAKTIRLDVRSPRAKNPAPYDVDLDELWLAVE